MKYDIEGLKFAYDIWMFKCPENFVYFWSHKETRKQITKASFSQWYPCHFTLDGIDYNCAEQYMMAEKAKLFGDEDTRIKIFQATEPDVIKHLGREVKNFDSKKWDAKSGAVVIRGNVAKFGQNEDLLKVLLATEKKVLVEASPYDRIWGIGMGETEAEKETPHTWKGMNKLGFALMEVRYILKENRKPEEITELKEIDDTKTMNNEFLKYCKYYKGEEKCPLSNFGCLEKRYIELSDEDHKFWETNGLLTLKSFPEAYKYVMTFQEPFVRGMLASFVVLSYDHAPQAGVDFIFGY